METNQNKYTPTAGGPRPTLADAGNSVGKLGMLDMEWRTLNEPDGPQMQLATPFPLGVPHPETPTPPAAGEAGERLQESYTMQAAEMLMEAIIDQPESAHTQLVADLLADALAERHRSVTILTGRLHAAEAAAEADTTEYGIAMDGVAMSLGLDIFNYHISDVLTAIAALQQRAGESA